MDATRAASLRRLRSLDAERYARVQQVFEAAWSVAAGERAHFLETACGRDTELAREVAELLGAATARGGAMGEEALAGARLELDRTIDSLGHSRPERIGKYRVLGLLGQGGMGVVYEAEQDAPRRRVALKVVPMAFASEARLKRFRREAETLGRLRHPGIAEVYEAGTCDLEGVERPFFAMEYVRGMKLLHDAEARRLDTPSRLRLVASLCDAVQHAHERGVVHRDLKPANVMVDGEGRIKVLDFGIAHSHGQDEGLSTLVTGEGEILGTLGFMAPEQLEGRAGEIGPWSDVYAIGVIAYQLLAGVLPIETSGLALSAAARAVQARDPEPLGRRDPRLAGDVETIVDTCLRKEPRARYASAAAVAADLRRHLADLPISARALSRAERATKFYRRNRVLVRGVAATFLALLFGALATLFFGLRSAANARTADAARSEMRENLYLAQMLLASEAAGEGWGSRRIAELTTNWSPRPGEVDLRRWEWFLFDSVTRLAERTLDLDFRPSCIAWSAATGELVLSGRGQFALYDGQSLERTADLADLWGIVDVAWSPSAASLACVGFDACGVWDRATETWHWNREDLGLATGVGWVGEELVFALVRPDLSVPLAKLVLFDAASGAELARSEEGFGPFVGRLELGPDDDTLALVDAERALTMFSISSWRVTGRGTVNHPHAVGTAAWSPGGDWVASRCAGRVHLWSAKTLREVKRFDGGGRVDALAWHPDGKRLTAASGDAALRTWDVGTRRLTELLRGHEREILALVWSPDGERLVSASNDATLRVWKDGAETPFRVIPFEPPTDAPGWDGDLEWHPSGDELIAWTSGPMPRRLTPTTGGDAVRVDWPAWSADGELLAGILEGVQLVVHDEGSGEARSLSPNELRAGWFAWSPVARELAYVQRGSLFVLDVASDRSRSLLSGFGRFGYEGTRPVWSRDGSSLAVVQGRALIVVSAVDGEERWRWEGPDADLVSEVVWGPGDRLAAAYPSGMIRIFDLGSDAPEVVFYAHGAGSLDLAWHPLEPRLATAGGDGTVKLWELPTARLAATFRLEDPVVAVGWSPAGDQLAAVTNQFQVHVFDARIGLAAEAER